MDKIFEQWDGALCVQVFKNDQGQRDIYIVSDTGWQRVELRFYSQHVERLIEALTLAKAAADAEK